MSNNLKGQTMVIMNLDDFCADPESNALNWIFGLKAIYPNFKVTLFTILGRWDVRLLRLVKTFTWIELAAHGWKHQTNDETLKWTKRDWYHALNRYERTGLFTKIWKSPNWETSALGYHVLKEFEWAVAVRSSQIKNLPIGMKYYSFENNPFAVHGHTWTMEAHQKEGMFNNWSRDTNFDFVSNWLEEKV